MTVEDCLRGIKAKVALVRYFAASAIFSQEQPDADVFAGMETVCEEIELLTKSVGSALSATALDTKVKAERDS